MTLTDSPSKLGGEQGEQGERGGVAAISKLFGSNDIQWIVSTLRSQGLGQQVQSWVGNGQNMPISGADIKDAVDPQRLRQVAQQQGMSADQLSDQVAQALPHLVDQATPNGQIPKQGGSMDSLMDTLKGDSTLKGNKR